jgi:hypothetical protein
MATNTIASEFLVTVNRLQISLMIRDPYVAAAFRAAEDDGFAPSLVLSDRPRARSSYFPAQIDVSGIEVSWLPQNKTRRRERRAQVGLD